MRAHLVVIALVVVGCSSAPSAATAPPVSAAATQGLAAGDYPPPRSMWFGKTFDPRTFVLTGKVEAASGASPLAVVATLSRETIDEPLTVEVRLNGKLTTLPPADVKAGSNLYGFVLPLSMIDEPGLLLVNIVDVGGNTLASGAIKIAP